MLAAITLVVLLSVGGPASPTTVPGSPGAGLGLEPGPPAPVGVPAVPSVRPRASSSPAPPDPTSSGSVSTGPFAALIAGIAVLALRVRRIRTAERSIRLALQDNLFSDVGADDLHAILRHIVLLDPSEASATVARLTDNEVGVWMRELDGWRGGLGADEQAEYFRALAGKLRPDQLARLTDYGKTEAVVAGALESSPATTRVALAIALWTRRGPGDEGWNAVAELIESAPGPALAAELSSTSIDTVVESLFEPFERHSGATPALDLQAAHRFAIAARRVPAPEIKAQLFAALVTEATGVGRTRVSGPTKMPDLLAGVGGLLRGDARHVVGDLNHRVDPHANITARWVGEMIQHDRHDVLDVVLTELMGGPDRLAHFRQAGTDPADPYPNASNLGYFVGAYGRAIEAIADRADERVGLVSRLFALFTGVVPVPGGGAVGIPLGPLVDSHAAGVVSDLEAGVASLKQTLWGLAKPRSDDGRLWNGAGTSQFQDAWQEVVDVR